MNILKTAAALLLAAGLFFASPVMAVLAEEPVVTASSGSHISDDPIELNDGLSIQTKAGEWAGFRMGIPYTVLCSQCHKPMLDFCLSEDQIELGAMTIDDPDLIQNPAYTTLSGPYTTGYTNVDNAGLIDLKFIARRAGETNIRLTFAMHQVAPELKECPECHAAMSHQAVDEWITYTRVLPVKITSEKVSLPGLDKKLIQYDENNKQLPAVDETERIIPGSRVTFQLNSNVPTNLFGFMRNLEEDGSGYLSAEGTYPLVFHDKMPYESWFFGENRHVYLGSGEKEVEVTDFADFQYFEEGDESMQVTIDLIELFNARNEEGNNLLSVEDIHNGLPVRVEYDAWLDMEVVPAAHPNTAWVSFPKTAETARAAEEQTSAEDTVRAHVFGLQVLKYDVDSQKKTGLPGAVFVLRKAGQEPRSSKDLQLTTDENGWISLTGIQPGDYYLEEIEAPQGYILVRDRIPFTVSLKETGEDHVIELEVANKRIPSTGGSGTVVFTAAGCALLAGAWLVKGINRRN